MDDRLRELHQQGSLMKDIAAAIGVSVSSLSKRAQQLGLPHRKRGQKPLWTPELDPQLRELRSQGLGYHQIGEILGFDNGTIRRRVEALGLPTWGRGGGRRSTGPRATNRVKRIRYDSTAYHPAG